MLNRDDIADRLVKLRGKRKQEEIAKAVGYHGVSNFYHVFQQRFGETPQTVRELLQKNRANIF